MKSDVGKEEEGVKSMSDISEIKTANIKLFKFSTIHKLNSISHIQIELNTLRAMMFPYRFKYS